MLERAHVGVRARRRWIVRVVVVAVLLAGAVLVGRDWLATNRATERTEDRLRAARHDLGVTSDDHDAAVAEVEALRATLEAELATLDDPPGASRRRRRARPTPPVPHWPSCRGGWRRRRPTWPRAPAGWRPCRSAWWAWPRR